MNEKDKPDGALAAKQRVEEALEALRIGLGAYVAKHMRDRHGKDWRHLPAAPREAIPEGSWTPTRS